MAWNQTFWSLGGAIALTALLPAFKAIAQISPDGSTATMIEATENRLTIEGGDRAGGNLFHSFREFSIPTGGEAYFNNAIDVANIFSRVTGGQISNIDGLIRANGTANLFLLNPAGIVFGPNARLDLGGSFFGTTARSIQFADGVEFAADTPAPAPLLTMSVPVGLQFGANPGAIQVRGNGYTLPTIPDNLTPEESRLFQISLAQEFLNNPNSLRVKPGRTLGLIGSTVDLDRAIITASDGRVALGTVESNQLIGLTEDDLGITVDFLKTRANPESLQALPSLNLVETYILTSGESGGEILVWGNWIDVLNSSIISDTIGSNSGRRIVVVSDRLNLDRSKITTELFSRSNAIQKSGDILIEAGSLNLQDSYLSSVIYGQGNAGNINVFVRNGALFSSSDFLNNSYSSTGISSSLGIGAIGKSGNITVVSGDLRLIGGAQISSSTFGEGDAGSITIKTDNLLEIIGISNGIFSGVSPEGKGQGGTISVEAGSLNIRDSSSISSNTFGQGNSGTIEVRVKNSLEILDGSLLSFASPGSIGQAGNILIESKNLSMRGNSAIYSNTFSQGDAGDITINVQGNLELFDEGGIFSDVIETVETGSTGNAGSILIQAESLVLRNNSGISSSTFGQGNAGAIVVYAQENIELLLQDVAGYKSGIFSISALGAKGNAGNIILSGREVLLSQARVTSDSEVEGLSAGNVDIYSDKIVLTNNSLVSANTRNDRGNLDLRSDTLILRDGSVISTNAQETSIGGNITIETQTLTALENSDITANAENANGGRINIRSLGIFGTAFRNTSTPDSDITASSALGAEFSGTVQINTPTIDPSAGLLTISENLTDISDRLNQTFCRDVARSGGSFTITGRGGIAATPDTFLDDFGSPAMEPLEPIARSTSPTDHPSIAPESRPETSPIVEANTWQREPDGRLILIAQGNAIAPPGLRLRDCPLPSTSAP